MADCHADLVYVGLEDVEDGPLQPIFVKLSGVADIGQDLAKFSPRRWPLACGCTGS
jgi:hypothetical protein